MIYNFKKKDEFACLIQLNIRATKSSKQEHRL